MYAINAVLLASHSLHDHRLCNWDSKFFLEIDDEGDRYVVNDVSDYEFAGHVGLGSLAQTNNAVRCCFDFLVSRFRLGLAVLAFVLLHAKIDYRGGSEYQVQSDRVDQRSDLCHCQLCCPHFHRLL
eukprot:PhF_6_TR27978/c1_g2_i3/m.41414